MAQDDGDLSHMFAEWQRILRSPFMVIGNARSQERLLRLGMGMCRLFLGSALDNNGAVAKNRFLFTSSS